MSNYKQNNNSKWKLSQTKIIDLSKIMNKNQKYQIQIKKNERSSETQENYSLQSFNIMILKSSSQIIELIVCIFHGSVLCFLFFNLKIDLKNIFDKKKKSSSKEI
ncbi:hypothetical protein ABPG74_006631 [Tetrahymena malaccensis]